MTRISEAQHKYHERAALAQFVYDLGAAMVPTIHSRIGASIHSTYKKIDFSIYMQADEEGQLIYHITCTRKNPNGGYIVEEFGRVTGTKVLETVLRYICEVEAQLEALYA